MSISCTSDYYYRGVAYASIMIIVYPIGVPLLYFALLHANKDEIMNRDVEGWKASDDENGTSKNSDLNEAELHYLSTDHRLPSSSVRETTKTRIGVSREASMSIAATESTVAAANLSLISFLWASYEPRYVFI